MGLDNGLILHSKEPIDFPREIIDYIDKLPVDAHTARTFPYKYELCYWRKCWNLRREIGHALGAANVEYVDKSWLTISDVKNIWHAINQLSSRRVWESGDSIWSWSEIKDHLARDLLIIDWLIYFMRQHEESEYMVEFYDSY